MNGDQNLLAGIGKVHQFAQAGLGFTKGCNHVTTMVLFLLTAREMLNPKTAIELKLLP
jgi:multisubunit Na+/H+ antiporter MnhB subunit